jgi:hypothetical protein
LRLSRERRCVAVRTLTKDLHFNIDGRFRNLGLLMPQISFDTLWNNHPLNLSPPIPAPCSSPNGTSNYTNQCAIKMGECFIAVASVSTAISELSVGTRTSVDIRCGLSSLASGWRVVTVLYEA